MDVRQLKSNKIVMLGNHSAILIVRCDFQNLLVTNYHLIIVLYLEYILVVVLDGA